VTDADWDRMVLVGRVARPHGIRGQVIVNPETDFPEERFAAGRTLFVRRPQGVEPLVVTAVRFHQGRPIVSLQGVETLTEAETLAGADLRIPEDELQPLPPGTYYRHDLVGCRVRTVAGREIGEVSAVEGAPGGSRLVIGHGRLEVQVPLVEGICVQVDPAAREIVIDPPEGLLDVNARGNRESGIGNRRPGGGTGESNALES
jgi:16S rRNA processing protein RimM